MLRAIVDFFGVLRLFVAAPPPYEDTESFGEASVWPRDPDSVPRFLIHDDDEDEGGQK